MLYPLFFSRRSGAKLRVISTGFRWQTIMSTPPEPAHWSRFFGIKTVDSGKMCPLRRRLFARRTLRPLLSSVQTNSNLVCCPSFNKFLGPKIQLNDTRENINARDLTRRQKTYYSPLSSKRVTLITGHVKGPSRTFFKLVPLFQTKITCFTKILWNCVTRKRLQESCWNSVCDSVSYY